MAYDATCCKFLKFMTRENAGTSAAPWGAPPLGIFVQEYESAAIRW
jgi:hypothetical protein